MLDPWALLAFAPLPWVLFTIFIALAIHYAIKAPFRQFSELPQKKPHWFFGNKSFMTDGTNMVEHIKKFYEEMKHHKFCIYWDGSNPCLFVTDLELIKKIQITDFDHFQDLGFVAQKYRKKVSLPFGLADTYGEEWKLLKRHMTPAFSGPKVKKAAKAVNEVSNKMTQYVEESLKKGEKLELTTVIQQFAMTTIASVVFGIDINCFKDKNNEFMKQGDKVIDMYRFIGMEMFPSLMTWFKINLIHPGAEKFFTKLGENIVKQRKASTAEHNDVLHSLIKGSEEAPDVLTPYMMSQTMNQFFADGYWTFTESYAGAFFLLATQPDIQEKLQEEVDAVMEEKAEVTEEDLREMPYLDQVLSESLRIFGLPNTSRFCTKAYTIPGTKFTVPEGMKVMIPTSGLHSDPDLWTDPTTFNPDRFSNENKSKHFAGAYQPFGLGPKQCLGYNLMKMESKVMFCHFLRSFRVEPTEELSTKIELDPQSFMKPKGLDKIAIVRRS